MPRDIRDACALDIGDGGLETWLRGESLFIHISMSQLRVSHHSLGQKSPTNRHNFIPTLTGTLPICGQQLNSLT